MNWLQKLKHATCRHGKVQTVTKWIYVHPVDPREQGMIVYEYICKKCGKTTSANAPGDTVHDFKTKYPDALVSKLHRLP